MEIMSLKIRHSLYTLLAAAVGFGLLFGAVFTAPISAEAATPEVLFSDGFEDGDFSNWSTVDPEWKTINSSDVEGSWKARAGAGMAATSSVLVKYIDTTDYQNISISFSHKDNGLEEVDSVQLQTTYTGGGAWIGPNTELKGSDSGWSQQNIGFTNTTADDKANFGIRFVADLDAKSDEFDLDDVVVTGEPIEQVEETPEVDTPENDTEPVSGCTDSAAVNYDPAATEDDESCEFVIEIPDETLPEQCIDTNLLDNASFEEPVVDDAQDYTFITNPTAWLVAAVAGGSADLEFHNGWQGNAAAHGLQYVELDGDESTTITQSVSGLEADAEYTLFWDFAARQNTDAAQNHLGVMLDGTNVATSGPAAGAGVVTSGDWVSGSYTFVATSSAVEIAFSDVGESDSYGTFLDNTVLCQTAAAPDPDPVTWTWEGHKYRDEAGTGELTEGLVGEPGWTMELLLNNDGALQVLKTATTSADGSYEFTLAADEVPEWASFSDIAVREENREGWTPTGVFVNGDSLGEYNPEEVLCGAFYEGERRVLDIPGNDFEYDGDYIPEVMPSLTIECDFLNQPPEGNEEGEGQPEEEVEEEEDGTTYGTRVRRTPQPEPQVLGAATSTAAAPQCGRLLYTFMQQGEDAPEQQIQLLQIFLNGQGYLVPVTGEFDAATDQAVRDFQAAHQADVLDPWYEAGLMDHQNPTGYVYRTTRWKINNIVCPDSEAFPELR